MWEIYHVLFLERLRSIERSGYRGDWTHWSSENEQQTKIITIHIELMQARPTLVITVGSY